MKKVIIFLIFLISSFLLNGQSKMNLKDKATWTKEFTDIVDSESISEVNFFNIKPSKRIDPINVFVNNKEIFGLSEKDEMKLIRIDTCQLGELHYRYQQYHNGYLVEGAQLVVHSKESSIVNRINGRMIPMDKVPLKVAIDTNLIQEIISKSYPSYKIMRIQEVVYTNTVDSIDINPVNSFLAIKVLVTNKLVDDNFYLYIDAKTMKIAKMLDTKMNGECITLYNGSRHIHTSWYGTINRWRLVDDDRGVDIRTYLGTVYTNNEPLKDNDDNWSAVEERGTTSAHWATGISYDYFKSKFGRNSMSNQGGRIDVRADYPNPSTGSQLYSAFQSGAQSYSGHDFLAFGKGDGVNARHFASLDMVGHEFTHGVTYYAAGLGTTYESGALNESFSDIFGVMIEFSIDGGAYGDYIIGDDYAINPAYKRSLANPKQYPTLISFGSPNTYKGEFWCYGPQDKGGVHVNCGVQNYWFYLLAEGGSGINDNGFAYSVQGIGREKAAKIVYRNLTTYIFPSANYQDARAGSIWAAEDLYGVCSNEVQQVINAWNAVGVSTKRTYTPINICGNITGTKRERSIEPFVFAPNCTTKIKSGANKTYQSATYIEFLGGFEVELGATFNAEMYTCPMLTP